MSVSIEDLISSLACNHIGQEQTDLAALQAQLAQTLYSHTVNASGQQVPCSLEYSQPCNTPTTRTPSHSFSFGQVADQQRLPLSLRVDNLAHESDEMDERMVEDVLMPSPMATSALSSPTIAYQNKGVPASAGTSYSVSTQQYHHITESPSLFTTSDPFYIQAAQSKDTPPPSIFSQTGMPCHQSPFMLQQQTFPMAPIGSGRIENRGFVSQNSPAPQALLAASSGFDR